MKRPTVWLLLLGTLVVYSSIVAAREWKTADGGYSVEADFVAVEDGKVQLKKTDGKVISVPLERLSEADRSYVASLTQAEPTTNTEPTATAAFHATAEPAAASGSRAARAGIAVQETTPPTGQTYIGVKRCAACHFESFMQFQKDKHSKTFEILTEKYQEDPKCLECHTTGYGEPTGFKDMKSTPSLANNGCENCHGPGSKHEEVAKPFAKVKKLTASQEKTVRDSIWRVLPGTVCITCHTQKAHKATETPKELRTKK